MRINNYIPYIFILCGIFFLQFIFGNSFCFSQEKQVAFIKFKKTKQNYGFARQGEVIKFEYEFENTGAEPLIISDVKVSCGCTVAHFPKEPVLQGQKGIVLIMFDTKEKFDRQDRTVDVISNATNSPIQLRFKCVVQYKKTE